MKRPIFSGPYAGQQPNVVVTPDPTGEYNRYDTYLAIDPWGSGMVGICRRFYGPGVNYQDVLEFQSSSDGVTWTSSALPLGNYYSISDPWIGIAENIAPGWGQKIYVIALQVSSDYNGGTTVGSQSAAKQLRGSNVCCYTSSDSGKTWNLAVIPGSGAGNPDNTFGAIDRWSGVVYAIWNSNDVVGAGLNDGTLAFASSSDGQLWWASPAALHGGNSIYDLTRQGFNYVNIAVAPDDGSIHIVGLSGNTISYGRSTDRGKSFDFGVIATQQAGNNDIYQATSPLFMGPVNPPTICAAGNGRVFVAWSVDTGNTGAVAGPQMRICISGCNDGGTGWVNTTAANASTSVPLLPLGNLSNTPQDQYFLPRLVGRPDGTVGCAFLYCRVGSPIPSPLTTAQLSTCLAVSLPTELGETYFDRNSTTVIVVSNFSTSPVSSNPVHRFGNEDGYFIGDFIGLVANSSAFVPYWSDTRHSGSGLGTAQIVMSFLEVQSTDNEYETP